MENYPLEPKRRPFDSAAQGLCGSLRTILFQTPEYVKEKAQEIRLRANLPIAIYTGRDTYFLKEQGKPTQRFDRTLPIVSSQEILESFHNCCSYSVYSHQNEIRQGFITMAGGHRVGVCGTAVYEKNIISGIRDISSLNVRIAREVPGAANELMAEIKGEVSGVLIAGPPASGKTTILRDLARQLSLQGKIEPLPQLRSGSGRKRNNQQSVDIRFFLNCFQDALDQHGRFARPCGRRNEYVSARFREYARMTWGSAMYSPGFQKERAFYRR